MTDANEWAKRMQAKIDAMNKKAEDFQTKLDQYARDNFEEMKTDVDIQQRYQRMQLGLDNFRLAQQSLQQQVQEEASRAATETATTDPISNK